MEPLPTDRAAWVVAACSTSCKISGGAVEKIVTGYPLVPNCGWTTMGIILIPFASKIWYPSSLWAL